MKLFKKNQVIIYIIALMLMTAGYLNYTTNQPNDSVETSMKMESDDTQLADIGDAKLVSSNDIVSGNTTNTSVDNSVSSNTNTTNITNETNSKTNETNSNNTNNEANNTAVETNSSN